jgi:hypothetical protein
VKKAVSESNIEETNRHGPSGVCECGDPAEPHLVGLRGQLPEDQAAKVREWIWVLTQLVEAGKSPHAVLAVDEEGEFVEVVTSVFIRDIPAFLREAADAVDEPEQSWFMDLTPQ